MALKLRIFVFILGLPSLSAAQCAMCKAVVESGDNELASGLNGGIMYLMAFPYLLVGLLIFFLIRQRRSQKKLTGI